MKDFIGISGYLNLLAGVALLIYWYSYAIFLPYRELSTTLSILVKNKHWKWINTLGVIGALAGLLGQAGLYVLQMEKGSGTATIGFYVATMGTAMILGTMLWDTILWPILARYDERFLDFQGPIYTSKTFLPYFAISGLIYSVGYVLVGIGIVQSGVLPQLTGYLIGIGAPAFGLGAMFGKMQVYPRTAGITMMGIGLIWIGFVMI